MTTDGVFSGSSAVIALPLNLRWNPLRGDLRTRPLKPYLSAGIGPVVGGSSGAFAGEDAALAGDRSAVTVAGFFGAGADILLGRRWSLGVNAGYTWMADVGEPIGGRFGYSGFDAAVSIGWMWGRGYE